MHSMHLSIRWKIIQNIMFHNFYKGNIYYIYTTYIVNIYYIYMYIFDAKEAFQAEKKWFLIFLLLDMVIYSKKKKESGENSLFLWF